MMAETPEEKRQKLWYLFPVLGMLTLDQRAELAGAMEFKALKASEYLTEDARVYEMVPFMLEGALRAFQQEHTGQGYTLFRAGAGEICPLPVLCELYHAAPIYVQASEAVELFLVPQQTYMDLLQSDMKFLEALSQMMVRHTARTDRLLDDIAFRQLDKRMGHYLFMLCKGQQKTLYIKESRIVSEVNAPHHVVERLLEDLQIKQIIQVQKDRIKILHPELLIDTTL